MTRTAVDVAHEDIGRARDDVDAVGPRLVVVGAHAGRPGVATREAADLPHEAVRLDVDDVDRLVVAVGEVVEPARRVDDAEVEREVARRSDVGNRDLRDDVRADCRLLLSSLQATSPSVATTTVNAMRCRVMRGLLLASENGRPWVRRRFLRSVTVALTRVVYNAVASCKCACTLRRDPVHDRELSNGAQTRVGVPQLQAIRRVIERVPR